MTLYSVNDGAALKTALGEIQDGDRIELASGTYYNLFLKNRDFEDGVTITSADPDDPAIITNRLRLSNVSGVDVENIDVIGGNLKSSSSKNRVEIHGSHDVTLRDMTVAGYIPDASEGIDASRMPSRAAKIADFGYDKGLSLRWSQDITIDTVEMTDLRTAMYLEYVQDSTLVNSDIHDSREGMNLKDIKGLEITGNHFHDLQEFSKDHVDMIQYWGVRSGWGIHDLEITDNLFHQPEGGDTQTIFGSLSNNKSVTATDFTITGNTILNAHPHGIRLGDVDGAEISDNVLLPNAPSVGWGWDPAIRLPDSSDIEISDNVVVDVRKGSVSGMSDSAMEKAGIVESGNLMLSHWASDDSYWGDLPEFSDGAPDMSYAEFILSLSKYADMRQEGGERPDAVSPPAPVEPDPVEPAPVEPKPVEPAPVEPKPTPPSSGIETDDLSKRTGTDGRDTLRAGNADTYLDGNGGNDRLYERNGSDVLEGGAGADTFAFDFRKGRASDQHDTILDLDFSQGDRVTLVGNDALFDNGAVSGNWMIITHGGKGAHLRDIGDIEEAIVSGALSYDSEADGNLILQSAVIPDRTIEIATLTADDLFL